MEQIIWKIWRWLVFTAIAGRQIGLWQLIFNLEKKFYCLIRDSTFGAIILFGLVDGLLIVGLTPIGRVTVTVLALNWERVINIRAADKEIGRHPPMDDLIQEKIDTN